MIRTGNDSGYTLIELLVTFFVFSLVSVGFYQVMFMGSRGTDTTESVVRISEEARLGFNRLIRDTREGVLVSADELAYRVTIDFDGNGTIGFPTVVGLDPKQNNNGDFEDLRFSIVGDGIFLNDEILVRGVDCIRQFEGGPCARDIFSFSSNRLEFDWNGDGVTTGGEIDGADGAPFGYTLGNFSGEIDTNEELRAITSVGYAFTVESGGRITEFFSEAQLRNRR
jgi:Prokaryotic N-terminal methylation motif